MTFRDAIDEMLNGLAPGADPAQILADLGFDDLPADAVSSALVHFAERAPIELADALSPIVTRVSPVPFSEGDLAEATELDAVLDDGGSVLDLLSEVGLATETDDPDTLGEIADLGDTVDERVADALEGIESIGEDVAEATESTFGVGDDAEPAADPDVVGAEIEELHLDELDPVDGADEATETVDDVFDGVDTATFTDLFDQVSRAADIDDLDSTDPADLDLD